MPIRSRPLRHRADSASRTRGLADGRDPCRRARAAAGAHLHPPPGAAHARGPLPVAVLTLARPTPVTVFAAERVAAARRSRPDVVLGVHLAGPFLGGAPGAHPVDLLRPVDLEWLLSLCDRHGDLVRLVTLAPEADLGLGATKALVERGIVVSLGHTTVDYDGARAAADAGATMVTHLFNGMGPLQHREPG